MPGCINVSDLSLLAACSETLEELWMADSGVRSLAPLKACTKLCKLDLRDCHYELYDQAEDPQLTCTQLAAPSSVELAGLVHTLQPNMPPDMQKDAAEVLAYMIDDEDVEAALEARDAITAAGAILAQVQLLGPDCSTDVQAAAARVLHKLADDHAQNQPAISAAGAIPALVQMLGPDCSAEVQEEAASALATLAEEHTHNQAAITSAGAISTLVRLLGPDSPAGVQMAAAATLDCLAALHAQNQNAMQLLALFHFWCSC
ncbi:hypothetical protein FOA52_010941 [Chlamydomonas sp. UWO 241]|nr:hypothetical protein FOA52_010941 [Chlamydomonas sp. UWO 241]